MWRYYPMWSLEEMVVGSIMTIMLVAVIISCAIVVTLLLILLKELWRIFRTHGMEGHQHSMILWLALGLFLLSFALFAVPGAALAAPYLVAWSFLAMCLVAEGVDITERRRPRLEGVH